MADHTTTTAGGFIKNHIDITHKPKRLQADMVGSEEESEEVVKAAPLSDIPKSLTLERVIKYYESNSNGECAKLYAQTAKWLRELQQKSYSKE